MRDLTPESVLSGVKNAQRNTWGGRYGKATPSVKKEGEVITLSTSLASYGFTAFDEIVLTIVMKFLFVPIWLVKQWYATGLKMVGNESYVDDMLQKWVQLGIVWKESDVTGQYVRPTYALFQMFNEPPYKYCDIPFNMLRHTICEEQLMFEVMSGESVICKQEKVMPRVSELGFEGKMSGTNVIAEEDFRKPFVQAEYRKVMDVEHQINAGMKDGLCVTEELKNFRYFSLVKKVDNTGEVKKDFKFHVPDLIIPVVRECGKPRSIAIEMEISNKKLDYVETMERYRDNNKFGAVYWFCRSSSIAGALREAFIAAGGTGACKTELVEFVVPSPDF